MPTRARMLPGSLYTHDLAFIGGQLYANAVGYNAVVRIGEHGFDFAWWPRCAETRTGDLIQQNHLQLNSIAAGNVAPFVIFLSVDRRHFAPPARRSEFSGRWPWRGVFRREPRAGRLRTDAAAFGPPARRPLWLLNSGYGEYGFIEAGARSSRRDAAGLDTRVVLSRAHRVCRHVTRSSAVPPVCARVVIRIARSAAFMRSRSNPGRVLGSLTWPAGRSNLRHRLDAASGGGGAAVCCPVLRVRHSRSFTPIGHQVCDYHGHGRAAPFSGRPSGVPART